MIQTHVTVEGGQAIREAYAKAKPELTERWYKTVRVGLLKGLRIVQTRYRGAGHTTATATRQGTGILRSSYTQDAQKGPEGVIGRLGLFRTGARGAALIYGPVHEEGATIRGRLAIPLPSIRTPSGTAPRPRDFPRSETFVLKGKFGGVICRKLANGQVQPLFALRSSVTIPARPPGGAINAAFAEVEPPMSAALEADALAVLGGP